jgi:hypothetical protein
MNQSLYVSPLCMIHPSPLAETIIFDRFAEAYFDGVSLQVCDDIMKINKRMIHRPMQPLAKSYLNHVQGTLIAIQDIEKRFPDRLNDQFLKEKKILIDTIESFYSDKLTSPP